MKKILILTVIFSLILRISVSGQQNEDFYHNCGTWIKFDSADFNLLTFDLKGAYGIFSNPFLIIVPQDSVVVLKINKKGTFVKEQQFKVLKVPLPSFEIRQGDKNISNDTIIGYNSFELRAIPDKKFAETNPRDARTRVSKWDLQVKQEGKIISFQSFNADGNTKLEFPYQINAKVIITIRKVQRMNFKNQIEETDVNKVFEFILL